MEEIELAVADALSWFKQEQDTPYLLIKVEEEQSRILEESIVAPLRRCYISDEVLNARASEVEKPISEILNAVLPDAGPVMSGDFGEILTYCYIASHQSLVKAFGPKKWRLKERRTHAAPLSDVVHFGLPNWPDSSADDVLFCSEVKTKATDSNSSPITSAISDCQNKDRIGRLAQTLVWLKERALLQDLGKVQIAHIDRFIHAVEHPPFAKKFHAVAVICESLLTEELLQAPDIESSDYTLIVISVPDLKNIYTRVFEAVHATVLS